MEKLKMDLLDFDPVHPKFTNKINELIAHSEKQDEAIKKLARYCETGEWQEVANKINQLLK